MTRAPHLDPLEIAVPEEIAADQVAAPSGPVSGEPRSSGATLQQAAEETFVVPASLEQTRYWTLAQIDPNSTASNMAISCELGGGIDPLVMEEAIAALTLRHEALRTLFRMVDGQLSQVILTRPLYEFTQQDLSRSDGPVVPQSELAAALSAHSHLKIDLEHGPVLRAQLMRLAPERHVLALTMNHIVCDGWSNGLLMRDLLRIYRALATGAGSLEEVALGAASELPELPFQFADFTVWQNEYLESERAQTALEFWTTHIPRDLPALDMPTDRPRQAGRSFPGTIASALLPAEINERLMAYCRKSGSTKHIVLLAAFEALCARFSGQRRFLLGSTIANRTQPGMEDVVGRFANPQIIVADVEGDPSFRDLELRVREWETTAYTHQDLPFSRIIEAFQVGQEGAGSQFLQVWFVYQRAFMQPQQVSGLTLTPLRSVSGGVDFDLLVSVVERAEGPRLQIEYNTDLFTSARVENLLAAFQQMLDGALADPDQRVSQVALGPADSPVIAAIPASNAIRSERTSSSTSLHAPNDVKGLLAGVAKRAAAIPHAVAIRSGTRSLSWLELEEQSRALAAHLESPHLESPHLESHSSMAEAATALIVLAPEVESLMALLALLRLGATAPRITPLSAHTTAADLRLAASNTTLLLAPGRLLRDAVSATACAVAYETMATLPAAPDARIRLETFAESWARPRLEENAVSGEALVTDTVLFSDTLHAVSAMAERLQLSARDGLLVTTPASPADALFDMLLALHSGATLDLAADQPIVALQPLLDERQATVAIAEPAQWRAWTMDGWSGDRRIRAVARGRQVVHAGWLGHTATVADAVAVLSGPSGAIATTTSRSGQFEALPGMELAVADTEGRGLPAGATGELMLSDTQPAGYIAQATSDGTFRVLGTSTSIIQLHGHRVRLADLDTALLSTPGVLDVLTVLQPREDGTPQLAAWVKGSADLNAEELRRSMAATLPQHLVPATVQVVAALPFRLDGSVDIARLHAMPAAAIESAVPVVEDPILGTDDVSRELSDIWKEVLNLAAVEPHLSFFSAGGNSLLLVRLFARINKTFGTRLPITTIFDAETIAELSVRLRQQGEIRAMVPVQTHGHRPPVFMIHSYLLYQGLSQALGRTQPFYGLRELEADSDLGMQERVSNYVREIRAVQPHGPYSVMGWCAAGPLTVEVARQLVEAGESIASVILFDSWLPGYLNSVEGVKANGSFAPKLNGIRAKLRRHNEKMRALSFGQRMQYVRGATSRFMLSQRNRFFIRHWSAINSLANRFHLPLPQFMYNTTLNTLAALHAYRARPVPIRLTLIRAHDTRDIPGASAACGWEQVAMHGVDVLWAPGDHETMFLGEKLEATAELVRRCLQHGELNDTQQAAALPAVSRADGRLLHAGTL